MLNYSKLELYLFQYNQYFVTTDFIVNQLNKDKYIRNVMG